MRSRERSSSTNDCAVVIVWFVVIAIVIEMDQLSKTDEAFCPRTSASCRRAERNVWSTVRRQGKECDRWIDDSPLFVSLPPGRTKKATTGQSSLMLEKGEVAGVVRALLESGRSDGVRAID